MSSHTVGGTLATGAYAYNTRDWVTGIDYPGRFTLTQAYDAVGNVTSQRYRRVATEARKRRVLYTVDTSLALSTRSTHAVIVVASQPINGFVLLYRNCEVVNESPRVVETVA